MLRCIKHGSIEELTLWLVQSIVVLGGHHLEIIPPISSHEEVIFFAWKCFSCFYWHPRFHYQLSKVMVLRNYFVLFYGLFWTLLLYSRCYVCIVSVLHIEWQRILVLRFIEILPIVWMIDLVTRCYVKTTIPFAIVSRACLILTRYLLCFLIPWCFIIWFRSFFIFDNELFLYLL